MVRTSVGAGLVAWLICSAAVAAAPQKLSFSGLQWRADQEAVRVEQFDGRETLLINGGVAWLEDVETTDAVVEFDVLLPAPDLGFGGFLFRARDADNYEDFYLRAHLSNQPDALQYQPVVNGVDAWQIFSSPRESAATPLAYGEWMRVKAVIAGDRADFYVDSDQPVLHVPDLNLEARGGAMALRGSAMPFRFSRFSVRNLGPDDAIVGTAPPVEAIPETLIDRWQVSAPFAESRIADTTRLPEDLRAEDRWTVLGVEDNGIANLARAATHSREHNTVLARVIIEATRDTSTLLHFGYSDRVRIFVNGRLQFAGDAGWATRDYRFLGTVGRQDAVAIDLEPGRNEVTFAVSESFGGWAVTADLPQREGLSVLNEPPG